MLLTHYITFNTFLRFNLGWLGLSKPKAINLLYVQKVFQWQNLYFLSLKELLFDFISITTLFFSLKKNNNIFILHNLHFLDMYFKNLGITLFTLWLPGLLSNFKQKRWEWYRLSGKFVSTPPVMLIDLTTKGTAILEAKNQNLITFSGILNNVQPFYLLPTNFFFLDSQYYYLSFFCTLFSINGFKIKNI